ncbi:MAG TPA: type IV toxin-antitoxin system AbiEi family antitoxin domain-containing protein [Acidimicrobiia bacterium]|nr:type IV toxin-antitoxin system AbiEi family antitoxin domain-containing protein [Acidimicrobiia bacterium]
MARDEFSLLIEVARQRFGVTSDEEARRCGLSQRQISRMLNSGVFLRPQPGVLIVGAAPTTWEQEVAIAVLSAGPGAVASHMTAAAMWSMLNTSGGRVEVTVPRWDRTRRPYVVHESLDLAAEDVTIHNSIAITSPARTVVDLGAVFPSAVSEAFGRGQRAGLVELYQVIGVVNRVGRKGRRGTAPARELIREKRRYPDRTESRAEDIFLKISRLANLPEPVQQYEVRDESGWFVCRADFGYPEARLVIFIDGFTYHSDVEAFQKDRNQQNLLELINWKYLRFTYRDVVHDPMKVAYQVRLALNPPVLAD